MYTCIHVLYISMYKLPRLSLFARTCLGSWLQQSGVRARVSLTACALLHTCMYEHHLYGFVQVHVYVCQHAYMWVNTRFSLCALPWQPRLQLPVPLWAKAPRGKLRLTLTTLTITGFTCSANRNIGCLMLHARGASPARVAACARLCARPQAQRRRSQPASMKHAAKLRGDCSRLYVLRKWIKKSKKKSMRKYGRKSIINMSHLNKQNKEKYPVTK